MAKKKKKSVWTIIPSRDPDDQLYNRRLITYFGLAYSAIWFQEILIVIVVAIYLKAPLDAAGIGALLGVPTTLAGLGFWKYLEAAKKKDCEEDVPLSKPDSKRVNARPEI